ncbi:FkbM family methyltransferase [Loktanella sp. IMCC34160]|uniref:FkbM family methyltransferase n=1 Tax=Loktanella sp. IMCC34160 TaxID=2510646 RepID=UPI00101CBA34|nr:FkbM family methyltransferase [Loktanella sp. IMCC34160]RYG91449.1 FkbM family methyltransferase [Loktanella sp. IMCC34160]
MSVSDHIRAAQAELKTAQSLLSKALATEKSRRRGPIVRQLYDVRRMLDPSLPYASQAGQDMVLDGLFQKKTGGTFVDIGGYDGVTGSNTLFFEQNRGWTGVLVEPMPDQLAKAGAARKCPCLGYAAADRDGEATFIAVTEGFTQMSGLEATYDPSMLTRVRNDPRHAESAITVQTRMISSILKEAALTEPDFISLDIEGGELAALRVFPFDRHAVRAWAIENNTGTPEIAQLMKANGYDLVEFCGPDEIYLRRS